MRPVLGAVNAVTVKILGERVASFRGFFCAQKVHGTTEKGPAGRGDWIFVDRVATKFYPLGSAHAFKAWEADLDAGPQVGSDGPDIFLFFGTRARRGRRVRFIGV